jgi:hypothetical protein
LKGSGGGVVVESSRLRLGWDAFVILCVVVTGVVVPFQIAFVREVTVPGSLVVYLLDAVFLLDIRFNFLTTFRARGVEERDSRRIGVRYRKTLLPWDLAAVIPLDALFLTSGAVVGGIPVALLLRLPRMLRLVRLFSIFRRWERMPWSRTGYLRIVKLALTFLLLVHWIGCGWFLVAVLEGFPSDSWAVVAGIRDLPPGGQYVRSVYWGRIDNLSTCSRWWSCWSAPRCTL